MAFSAHFSISQGSDPQSFSVVDDSTGSDVNLTGRTISLELVDGEELTGATISWPIAEGATKVLTDALTRDFALNITVDWASSSPIPGSTYTYTALYGFTGNTNAFIYGLIQDIAAQNSIINDTNYFDNLSRITQEVDNCDQAVTYGDQFSGQSALDRSYEMIINADKYF